MTDQGLHSTATATAWSTTPTRSEKQPIISGRMKLTLWISLDVPDTDFEVDVYEIQTGRLEHPVGQRHEAGPLSRVAATRRSRSRPGEVLKYEFTTFNWFSRRIATGSRLRLVVSSPNSVFVQKNYNGGGDVSRERPRTLGRRTSTLHHDAEHPSGLELPTEE